MVQNRLVLISTVQTSVGCTHGLLARTPPPLHSVNKHYTVRKNFLELVNFFSPTVAIH